MYDLVVPAWIMVSACLPHVQSCWWGLHLSTYGFLYVTASFAQVKEKYIDGQLWTTWNQRDCSRMDWVAWSLCSAMLGLWLSLLHMQAGRSIFSSRQFHFRHKGEREKGKQTGKWLLTHSVERRRAFIGIKHNRFLLGSPVPTLNMRGIGNKCSQQTLFSRWNVKWR